MARKQTGKRKGDRNRPQDSAAADEHRLENTFLSSCREWEEVWNRFLGVHRTWWDRYQDAGPA